MNAATNITPMPAPPVRMVPCPARCNNGVDYISDGHWDPDVEPVTCEECGGLGDVPEDHVARYVYPQHADDPEGKGESERGNVGAPFSPQLIDDEPRCAACTSTKLRFVSITSREPYGEQFTDEGYRCLECGTVTMETTEPRDHTASEDLIGELIRSIALAQHLNPDPAYRLGLILATRKLPVRKPPSRIKVEAEKGAA
jgi:hypothetical protein